MTRIPAYVPPAASDVVEVTPEQYDEILRLKAKAREHWAIYRNPGLILSYRVDAMRKAKELDEQALNVGRPRP